MPFPPGSVCNSGLCLCSGLESIDQQTSREVRQKAAWVTPKVRCFSFLGTAVALGSGVGGGLRGESGVYNPSKRGLEGGPQPAPSAVGVMAGSGPGSLGEQAPLTWQGPKVTWPLTEQHCLNLGKLLPVPSFSGLPSVSGQGRQGPWQPSGEWVALVFWFLIGTPHLSPTSWLEATSGGC